MARDNNMTNPTTYYQLVLIQQFSSLLFLQIHSDKLMTVYEHIYLIHPDLTSIPVGFKTT